MVFREKYDNMTYFLYFRRNSSEIKIQKFRVIASPACCSIPSIGQQVGVQPTPPLFVCEAFEQRLS